MVLAWISDLRLSIFSSRMVFRFSFSSNNFLLIIFTSLLALASITFPISKYLYSKYKKILNTKKIQNLQTPLEDLRPVQLNLLHKLPVPVFRLSFSFKSICVRCTKDSISPQYCFCLTNTASEHIEITIWWLDEQEKNIFQKYLWTFGFLFSCVRSTSSHSSVAAPVASSSSGSGTPP